MIFQSFDAVSTYRELRDQSIAVTPLTCPSHHLMVARVSRSHMTPEPSGRPAARSFPDGSKRANDATETRDVWMVVGWVMVNGSVRAHQRSHSQFPTSSNALRRVAFMAVCGQACQRHRLQRSTTYGYNPRRSAPCTGRAPRIFTL